MFAAVQAKSNQSLLSDLKLEFNGIYEKPGCVTFNIGDNICCSNHNRVDGLQPYI